MGQTASSILLWTPRDDAVQESESATTTDEERVGVAFGGSCPHFCRIQPQMHQVYGTSLGPIPQNTVTVCGFAPDDADDTDNHSEHKNNFAAGNAQAALAVEDQGMNKHTGTRQGNRRGLGRNGQSLGEMSSKRTKKNNKSQACDALLASPYTVVAGCAETGNHHNLTMPNCTEAAYGQTQSAFQSETSDLSAVMRTKLKSANKQRRRRRSILDEPRNDKHASTERARNCSDAERSTLTPRSFQLRRVKMTARCDTGRELEASNLAYGSGNEASLTPAINSNSLQQNVALQEEEKTKHSASISASGDSSTPPLTNLSMSITCAPAELAETGGLTQ